METGAGAAPDENTAGIDTARDPDADEAASATSVGGTEAERAREELSALNDRHLRLAAEFDNYRKRSERERADTWPRAQAEVVAGLLDVLDDLGRVATIDASTATAGSLLEGIQLVERKLHRALAAAGLEEVDAEGRPFDPTAMDALMTIDTGSAEEDDTVGSVLQKGYRFKGQLIRPARVQVRKYNG